MVHMQAVDILQPDNHAGKARQDGKGQHSMRAVCAFEASMYAGTGADVEQTPEPVSNKAEVSPGQSSQAGAEQTSMTNTPDTATTVHTPGSVTPSGSTSGTSGGDPALTSLATPPRPPQNLVCP